MSESERARREYDARYSGESFYSVFVRKPFVPPAPDGDPNARP